MRGYWIFAAGMALAFDSRGFAALFLMLAGLSR